MRQRGLQTKLLLAPHKSEFSILSDLLEPHSPQIYYFQKLGKVEFGEYRVFTEEGDSTREYYLRECLGFRLLP